LFAAVVLALFAALGWLTWHLVDQDRLLASQRLADERELAADVVVAVFEQRLSALERDLDAALSRGDAARLAPADAGSILVRISADIVTAWPAQRLLYIPQRAPFPPSGRHRAGSAEAIVAVAREKLNSGSYAMALDAYKRLTALGEAPVAGMPAAFAGALGQMVVYQRQNDLAALKRTAGDLDTTLRAGRWPVSHATYDFLREHVQPLIDARTAAAEPRRELAEAVEWLWEQRATPSFSATGRAARNFPSGAALVVWRGSAPDTIAMIVGRDDLQRAWMDALPRSTPTRQVKVAMTTPDGRALIGEVTPQERSTVRLSSHTTLPWTIQVTSRNDVVSSKERRRLLVAGVGILCVLIVAGACVIERTVARQIAVADLQSDFVSAVSHEFRTPLTTLCQLTELLMRNRVAADGDRKQYYELLHHESQRLRRLVETLLTFGRLEAGRMEFRMEAIDVVALVRATATEFSASAQARGHRVVLAVEDGPLAVQADRDVLRTLVWNLLENAAKYSPRCDTIWVTARQTDGGVALAVRDRGVGIPRSEQRRVFDRFVRGAIARSSDVGGTGVGLAMARRIAEAHGGRITLESEPGSGSTFTVTLPAAPFVGESPSPVVAAG
jgi:signal transduction histidine kinase